jgi:hypothetical protein
MKAALLELQPRLNKWSLDPGEKWGEFKPDQWSAFLDFFDLTGKVKDDLYTNQFIDQINTFDSDAVKQQAHDFKLS